MTNDETAAEILNQHGHAVSAVLDADNYREIKTVIVQALNLADEGKHAEAVKLVKPLNEGVRAEVEAVIEKKGGK